MQYSSKLKMKIPQNSVILPPDFIADMEQDLSSELPGRIAEIRKRQGLTQVQVAERLGTSQGNYALYETGARGVSLKLLPRMAEALGVSIEELLGLDAKLQRKRGPASKMEKLAERLAMLPPSKQKVVAEMLESWLDKAS